MKESEVLLLVVYALIWLIGLDSLVSTMGSNFDWGPWALDSVSIF